MRIWNSICKLKGNSKVRNHKPNWRVIFKVPILSGFFPIGKPIIPPHFFLEVGFDTWEVDENVLRFEVEVNKVILIDLMQAYHDVLEKQSDFSLFKSFLVLDKLF